MNVGKKLSLLLVMAVCTVAGGQELDGAVSDVPNSIREHLATVGSPWTRESARQFLGQLYEDREFSSWEKELLFELTSPNSETVEVHFSDGASLTVPHPDGEAVNQFEYLTKPRSFESLWTGSPNDMARLVDFSTLHPQCDMRVRHFLAAAFYKKWQKSAASNDYKPLRDEIDRALELMKKAGDETHAPGRILIFESCDLLDTRARDLVPDSIYDWVNGPPSKP